MPLFPPFPKELATIIADYCVELKLREWIQPEALFNDGCIWANPGAYEAGLLDLSQMHMHRSDASMNPALIEWIKKDPASYACSEAWRNPAAFDWMLEHCEKIDWMELSANPNKRAIELLIANPDKIDMREFLANPSAMSYIKDHPELLQHYYNKDYIAGNPEAIDIIKSYGDPVRYMCRDSMIALNPHPWAIEQCRLHWGSINIEQFSMNPGIFHYVTNKKLVKLLSRSTQ
jgi:hypothetical protein